MKLNNTYYAYIVDNGHEERIAWHYEEPMIADTEAELVLNYKKVNEKYAKINPYLNVYRGKIIILTTKELKILNNENRKLKRKVELLENLIEKRLHKSVNPDLLKVCKIKI